MARGVLALWGMRVRTLFTLLAAGGLIALLMRPRKQRAVSRGVRVPAVIDAEEVSDIGDTGDLYGEQVQPAFEPYVVDEDLAMEDGQNWLEQLEQSAAEGGPLPEEAIDLRDEVTGRYELRDLPVADRGSGGPGGL